MRIAVMGAGAVGCYYGGMLARAGHEVVLIGRTRHVAAIRRDGLLIDSQSFQARLPMQASTDASAVHGAKLVLCCVKSTDTETAGAALAGHLDRDALVLSLQNGVDNAVRLQTLLQHDVAPAVVYVATEMAAPGHVKHHGRGELVIGPSPSSDGLVTLFAEAAVPVEVSDNVAGALWAKLLLNCVYNALSAISQLPYGRLVQGEGVEDVMRAIVQECLAVARGEGVSMADDSWPAVERIARTMPGQLSSTAQDLARHKRSEIDHLNGYIVRRGEALGIATPVNRVLHSLVKLLESRSHGQRAGALT
ncbi:MAG: 2-dehydropantoate 2-reductase [Candidatus Accumulibacter sp.]|uniref:ketopantoate reductase family protein n=1 Tax=Accumulibacter sp. TaxID=2053492 RepID=UPI0019DAB7F1|nr:2-dehydropantoate 2-reductase [Accumulibacter sp.]MBE2259781.1 2-dehydropantoate 2-reductase [Paracoccaceae bacterium]MCP5248478.1 2-dehydropantoate 2-reductase [Accumulibacter sp.]